MAIIVIGERLLAAGFIRIGASMASAGRAGAGKRHKNAEKALSKGFYTVSA
jgi:hypothetical protein